MGPASSVARRQTWPAAKSLRSKLDRVGADQLLSATDVVGMADLAAFLETHSLSHLAPLLGDWTLPTLEDKLAENRAKFLSFLKEAGVTALKDRQGLTNAIAKARRRKENEGRVHLASIAGWECMQQDTKDLVAQSFVRQWVQPDVAGLCYRCKIYCILIQRSA